LEHHVAARRSAACSVFTSLLSACAGCSTQSGVSPVAQLKAIEAIGDRPVVYGGCRIVPPGDAFGVSVSAWPVDVNDAEYHADLSSKLRSRTYVAHPAPFFTMNVVPFGSPTVSVKPLSSHTFPVKLPFHASSPALWVGTSNDRTINVLIPRTENGTDCYEFDLSETTYLEGRPPSVSAHQGERMLANGSQDAWQLWSKEMPLPAGPSYDAGGADGVLDAPCRIYPEEVDAGAIDHAMCIRFPADATHFHTFAPPANTNDGDGPAGTYVLPAGARLRLRATWNEASCSAHAKVVIAAWKAYGLIFSNTTGNGGAIEIEQAYAANSHSPGDVTPADLDCLTHVSINDLQVMPADASGTSLRSVTKTY
jgi:hypothetical protein